MAINVHGWQGRVVGSGRISSVPRISTIHGHLFLIPLIWHYTYRAYIVKQCTDTENCWNVLHKMHWSLIVGSAIMMMTFTEWFAKTNKQTNNKKNNLRRIDRWRYCRWQHLFCSRTAFLIKMFKLETSDYRRNFRCNQPIKRWSRTKCELNMWPIY